MIFTPSKVELENVETKDHVDFNFENKKKAFISTILMLGR